MRAAIVGAEDAIAGADIVARRHLPGAGIDDVIIRRRDGNGADGRRLLVEDGLPGAPGIHGLPDAAAGTAEVEGRGPQ